MDFASAASGAQGDMNELDDPLSDELMFANEPPEHRQHEEIDDFDDDSGNSKSFFEIFQFDEIFLQAFRRRLQHTKGKIYK